jgi:hypothetical protein
MRTLEQLLERLEPYDEAEYIYDPAIGYLSWHVSTGGNIEPLFIEVLEPQKGYGTELYRRMARHLIAAGREPYHSLFAFRLKSNTVAGAFYNALGWTQQDLGQSIYKGDGTVIMWIEWSRFLQRLGIEPQPSNNESTR